MLDSKEAQDIAIVQDAPAYGAYLSDEAASVRTAARCLTQPAAADPALPSIVCRHLCVPTQRFDRVKSALTDAGIPHTTNERLVRGLDYYRHTAFEFSDSTGCGALLGGGRYDGLTKLLGGPDVPAIGWAAGVDRLLLASEGSSALDTPQQYRVAVCEAATQHPAVCNHN